MTIHLSNKEFARLMKQRRGEIVELDSSGLSEEEQPIVFRAHEQVRALQAIVQKDLEIDPEKIVVLYGDDLVDHGVFRYGLGALAQQAFRTYDCSRSSDGASAWRIRLDGTDHMGPLSGRMAWAPARMVNQQGMTFFPSLWFNAGSYEKIHRLPGTLEAKVRVATYPLIVSDGFRPILLKVIIPRGYDPDRFGTPAPAPKLSIEVSEDAGSQATLIYRFPNGTRLYPIEIG